MTQIRNLTCKTNPIKRKTGGNAVAAASYRSGTDCADTNNGKTYRYAGRSSDVEATYIFSGAGDDAPAWHFDRAALWSSVEANEKRSDSRTGRDVVVGLPWELSFEERKDAVFAFAQKEFLERGYVVDIAFHKYGSIVRENSQIFDAKRGETISGKEKIEGWREAGLPFLEAHEAKGVDTPHVKIERIKGGEISGFKLLNQHAHILISQRAWDSERGDWAAKVDPHFNKPQTAKNWRYDWPKYLNKALKSNGLDLRISCTASEGEDPLPLKREDLPNREYHIEKRGVKTTAKQKALFNRVQNEAVRAGFGEKEQTEAGDINRTERSEQAATGGWWRNMREHFSEYRHHWRAHLQETWERVKERWRGPTDREWEQEQ